VVAQAIANLHPPRADSSDRCAGENLHLHLRDDGKPFMRAVVFEACDQVAEGVRSSRAKLGCGSSRSACSSNSLGRLDPQPSFAREDLDAFGNLIARLEYDRSHERLAVIAQMQVEIFPRRSDSLESALAWDAVRDRLSYHAAPMPAADLEACRFRMRSSHVLLKQSFEDYARGCFERGPARSRQQPMNSCTRPPRVQYVAGSTTNRTSIVEVLKNRRGVCQDFAHFMIACLRSCGLAARYVAAIFDRPEGGEAAVAETPRMPGCPSTARVRMVGFRSDQHCMVGEDHVTLAWGRDFADCRRFRGMIIGGAAQTEGRCTRAAACRMNQPTRRSERAGMRTR